MELTRRDALAALAAAGVAVGGGAAALRWDDLEGSLDGQDDGDGDDDGEGSATLRDRDRETLVALARALYPSEVEGIPAFVETYVAGRVRDRPERVAGIREAVDRLDRNAREWFDAPFLDLPTGKREAVLDQSGVDVADPDPEGIPAARIRYYLVNELLYALYASPTGGRLVGIENPQGHPGGLDSYRRGPEGQRIPDDRRGPDDRPADPPEEP